MGSLLTPNASLACSGPAGLLLGVEATTTVLDDDDDDDDDGPEELNTCDIAGGDSHSEPDSICLNRVLPGDS